MVMKMVKKSAMKSAMKAKAAAPSPMKSSVSIGKDKLSKSAMAQIIADKVGIKRSQAAAVLAALAEVTSQSLKKAGKVQIPGIVMVKTRNKPATKARTAMMFGKECRIAAMKAKTVVKALPVKALKDEYK